MEKICVTIPLNADRVTCPICGQILVIEDGQIHNPCLHVDSEDYITPGAPFSNQCDIWFVALE